LKRTRCCKSDESAAARELLSTWDECIASVVVKPLDAAQNHYVSSGTAVVSLSCPCGIVRWDSAPVSDRICGRPFGPRQT